MPTIIRASPAEWDLREIWRYVAQDNLAAADSLIKRIGEKCQMLAAHPEMGQRRPELSPDLRSFVVGNYVVFYRPIEQGIEVARVIHSARDIDALF